MRAIKIGSRYVCLELNLKSERATGPGADYSTRGYDMNLMKFFLSADVTPQLRYVTRSD